MDTPAPRMMSSEAPPRLDRDLMKKWTSQQSQRTALTVSTSIGSLSTMDEENQLTVPQHQCIIDTSDDVHSVVEPSVVGLILDDVDDETDSSSVLSNGIPQEIVVFNDEEEPISVIETTNNVDMFDQLKALKLMTSSYKARIQSNENLLDRLEEEISRTKTFAQDILQERNELLNAMEDLEEKNECRGEQSFLLKMLLCFALFLYLCGASEQFLIAGVSMYLMFEFIASAV